jgi:hypothetical protein
MTITPAANPFGSTPHRFATGIPFFRRSASHRIAPPRIAAHHCATQRNVYTDSLRIAPRRITSLHAAPHRCSSQHFASQRNATFFEIPRATQRLRTASQRPATPRIVPPLSTPHLNATSLSIYSAPLRVATPHFTALRRTPHHFAPRRNRNRNRNVISIHSATRRFASRCSTPQHTVSPRAAPLRIATSFEFPAASPRFATRHITPHRTTSLRAAPQLIASHRLQLSPALRASTHRLAPHRVAPPRRASQRLFYSFHAASPRSAPLRYAPQLNATSTEFSAHRFAPPRGSSQRYASQRPPTILSAPASPPHRHATHRNVYKLFSAQRHTALRFAAHRIATPCIATQRLNTKSKWRNEMTPIISIHKLEDGREGAVFEINLKEMFDDIPPEMNDDQAKSGIAGIMLSDLLDHIVNALHQTTGRDPRDIHAYVLKVMRDEDRFKEKEGPSRSGMEGEFVNRH